MLTRFLYAVVAVACSCLIAISVAAARTSDPIAQKVVACYKAGSQTIQKMRDCSGAWVTPRVLMLCVLKADCAVLSDTPDGRALLDSTLAKEHLTRASALELRVRDFPKLPDPATVAECKKKTLSNSEFEECVFESMADKTHAVLLKCVKMSNDVARAACYAKEADPNLSKAIECLGNQKPDAEKIASCLSRQDLVSTARTLTNCIGNSSTFITRDHVECVIPHANENEKALASCLALSKKNKDRAIECLDRYSPEISKARKVIECIQDPKNDPVRCGEGMIGGAAGVVASCLSRARNEPDRVKCAMTIDPAILRANKAAACISRTRNADRVAPCLTPYVGDNADVLSRCVADKGRNALDNCVTLANPKFAEAVKMANCLRDAKKNTAAFACVAPKLGGDAVKTATCIANSDREAAAVCLLGDKPAVKIAQQIYKCVSNASDTVSLVANCTNGLIKDEKTRVAVTCVASSGGDRNQLAVCAANSLLPKEAARLVGCAANSQGPTSFALCSTAPKMNEEWRIAAECAVESGGNVVAFAGCSAGRLTIRELTKCLTGKSCFGPNNEVVKAVNGAGKFSEKAAHDTGKAIEKATHDAGRAIQMAAHDTGRAVGTAGTNAARAVGKAGTDTRRAVGQAGTNTRRAVAKAGTDVGEATQKAGNWVSKHLF